MLPRPNRRAGLALTAALLITACAHPNRASQRAVRQLTSRGAPFVLVFGSLTTPTGRPAKPTIRFVYQTDRAHPQYLLAALTLSNDRRFHAILRPPNGAAYLDHLDIEVGSETTGFDRILYVHLPKQGVPVAMYIGELRIAPAQNRNAQGEKVVVSVVDNFGDATKELKRLYPHFEGTFDNEARRPGTPSAAAQADPE
jgi:hypothetical protein